jgi:hypothetical protein
MQEEKAKFREIEAKEKVRQRMAKAKAKVPPRRNTDQNPRQRVAVKRLQELQKKWTKQTADDPHLPS